MSTDRLSRIIGYMSGVTYWLTIAVLIIVWIAGLNGETDIVTIKALSEADVPIFIKLVLMTALLTPILLALRSLTSLSKNYREGDYFSLKSIKALEDFVWWILVAFIGVPVLNYIVKTISSAYKGIVDLTIHIDFGYMFYVVFALTFMLITKVLAKARAAIEENKDFL